MSSITGVFENLCLDNLCANLFLSKKETEAMDTSGSIYTKVWPLADENRILQGISYSIGKRNNSHGQYLVRAGLNRN